MKNLLRTLAILAVAAFALLSQRSVTEAQSNLLLNPGFEEPYSGGLAQSWNPWHEEANVESDCTTTRIAHKPVWEAEVAGGAGGQLLYEGSRSQHVGNQFATWHAGVFQTISVTPGQRYLFTAYGWARASQDQYPAPSDFAVNHNVRVGIDPNGSGLWNDSDVVWGSAISPADNWQQIPAVEATASGSQITVFISADNAGAGQCRKHLDVWFDGGSLTQTGPPPTPTSPPATATPVQPTAVPATATPNWPTATPFPTATPWPTATPLPTGPWFTATPLPATAVPTQPPVSAPVSQAPVAQAPTATPVPPPTEPPPPTSVPPTAQPTTPPGGTICLNAFSDVNSNGQRDADEGYMAGVPLIIAQGSTVVGQAVSTGVDDPLCFEGLAVGSYDVAQQLGGGLEGTTSSNISIDVAEGQTIGLEFGSRFRANASNSGSNGGSDSDSSGSSDTTVADTSSADSSSDSTSSSTASDSATTADSSESAGSVESGLDLVAISGLIVLIGAVALLGAILFLLLRQS